MAVAQRLASRLQRLEAEGRRGVEVALFLQQAGVVVDGIERVRVAGSLDMFRSIVHKKTVMNPPGDPKSSTLMDLLLKIIKFR